MFALGSWGEGGEGARYSGHLLDKLGLFLLCFQQPAINTALFVKEQKCNPPQEGTRVAGIQANSLSLVPHLEDPFAVCALNSEELVFCSPLGCCLLSPQDLKQLPGYPGLSHHFTYFACTLLCTPTCQL